MRWPRRSDVTKFRITCQTKTERESKTMPSSAGQWGWHSIWISTMDMLRENSCRIGGSLGLTMTPAENNLSLSYGKQRAWCTHSTRKQLRGTCRSLGNRKYLWNTFGFCWPCSWGSGFWSVDQLARKPSHQGLGFNKSTVTYHITH